MNAPQVDPGRRVVPVTPSGLVDRLADAAHDLHAPAATAGHAVRVGVDSAVTGDGAMLADALGVALRERGLAVLRVAQEGFVRPRSLRLELGADDPDAAWERWYDDAGLRREVLDPLGPSGAMTWVPSLWDVETDRSSRAPRQVAAPGAVAIVDGRFLLRWELADAFDLVAHLQTSPSCQARRLTEEAERARVLASWQRYLDETDPAARLLRGAAAGVVVRHDDPRHPALVLATP